MLAANLYHLHSQMIRSTDSQQTILKTLTIESYKTFSVFCTLSEAMLERCVLPWKQNFALNNGEKFIATFNLEEIHNLKQKERHAHLEQVSKMTGPVR